MKSSYKQKTRESAQKWYDTLMVGHGSIEAMDQAYTLRKAGFTFSQIRSRLASMGLK